MTLSQEHFRDDALVNVADGLEIQTKLKGEIQSAEIIQVFYDTLPGNLPNTYGNTLWVWQNTIIPYGTTDKPAGEQAVEGNTQQGTAFFQGLSLSSKPYIVGYGTGKDRNTIVSTLQFFPGNPVGEKFESRLHVKSATPDGVVAYFETPIGNDPKAYGNWIGLWEARSARLDGVGMKTWVPISGTAPIGTQVVPWSYKFDTYYTLALGTQMKDDKPVPSTIGTTFTFKTSPFLI